MGTGSLQVLQPQHQLSAPLSLSTMISQRPFALYDGRLLRRVGDGSAQTFFRRCPANTKLSRRSFSLPILTLLLQLQLQEPVILDSTK